jgi:ParB/RepB/Spo0J family partition protein
LKNPATIPPPLALRTSEQSGASRVAESGALLDLPIDDLQDSPFQVRRYDDARVRDLAETIRKAGLLQPATVRRVGDQYQLIAGHGRRAAVRYLRDRVATSDTERARYSTLRCLVLEDVDDARAAALTAIENLQRDDGTELEQALMVSRARSAGAYRSAAEVAEAMGLKLRRVRQLLELADAPVVIQQAVDPGVMVPAKDPRKPGQRVRMLLTNALATRPFYDLVFEDELARLKAKKRVALSTCDMEARETEKERIRELAGVLATERTGQLLARAARGGWTVRRIDKHVRAAIQRRAVEPGPTPAVETSEEVAETSLPAEPTEPAPPPRLFERRGSRFVLFPEAFAAADASGRGELAGHLRRFLNALEAPRG